MAVYLDVDESFTVGQAWFASVSSDATWAVVFEDDGVTAYFYASTWDAHGEGSFGPVMDAMHIYNVANIADATAPCKIQIGWNAAGTAAMLLINGQAHAIFDRAGANSCCRTGFPPPQAESPFKRAEGWDARLEALFKQ